MPTRLQLRGSTLEGLRARVLNEYPAGSRILEAERVTEGGIAGFFTKTFYEAVVEVPDPVPAWRTTVFPNLADPVPVTKSTSHPVPPRAGVAALLADADTAEAAMHKPLPPAPPLPEVSTGSKSFDTLMVQLNTATSAHEPGPEPAGVIPAPLAAPGDAVLVIGLGPDALATARSMASATASSSVKTAGSFRVEGTEHLVGRQGLMSARAAGVIAGEPVFIAFGLGADGSLRANALTEMQADQVWVVVDATRKPPDTVAWVRRAGWATSLNALAVLGSENTLTPATVNDLGLPIGWIDGRKATRSAL